MENTILFEKFDDLYNECSADIPNLLDTNSNLLIDFFRGFKYPISSWPIILNERMREELEEASTRIPNLLQKIPSLYFENDKKKIADFYFNGDEALAEFTLMCQNKNIDISSRLDLTYTNEGFKVLEINMGSSIGGMEFQNFEPLITKVHPILLDNETEFYSKKTQSIYIEFIINKIEEYVASSDTELGIFIVGYANRNNAGQNMIRDFFNQFLQKEIAKRHKKANTYTDSIDKLKFIKNQLQYEGKQIHATLILDHALISITSDLFRALLLNKVYFPDHLGTTLLKDKRNLAILRKLTSTGKLNEDDTRIVLKYIPWTTFMENEKVTYKGREYMLLELLSTKKENFVIKIADGLQGKDVFVGKFCSQEQWTKILEKAFKEKNYIAQEFSESIDLLAPNSENDWKPHKLVWGAFGFGDIYGGAWVRMSANKNDGGVINSANGAIEGIVYESYKSQLTI